MADPKLVELVKNSVPEWNRRRSNRVHPYLDLSGAALFETVFGNANLTDAEGLGTCRHGGPSILDHRTVAQSGQLPLAFLRGCGLPDTLIEYLPSLLNHPIEFFSCFISYNHADKLFARLLHDTLQGRGVRCWLDEKQLLPGDNIYDHVDRGIRLWDKLLLCCSKNSLTSWWVDNEIGKAFDKEQALMKGRKEKVQVLIPLNLDTYLLSGQWKSGKASQVLERLAGDFRGWKRNHTNLRNRSRLSLVHFARTNMRGRSLQNRCYEAACGQTLDKMIHFVERVLALQQRSLWDCYDTHKSTFATVVAGNASTVYVAAVRVVASQKRSSGDQIQRGLS